MKVAEISRFNGEGTWGMGGCGLEEKQRRMSRSVLVLDELVAIDIGACDLTFQQQR